MTQPLSNELAYWINERWAVRQRRAAGLPAPWSADVAFRTVRFCNVHREDDRVTRWVRRYWNTPTAPAWHFAVGRMINWPDSLAEVRACETPAQMRDVLQRRAAAGHKVFTSAYTISTCGKAMDKLTYVFDYVVPRVQAAEPTMRYGTLADAATALMHVDGLGSFLAAQMVADMKNTVGHRLAAAPDWWTFSLPGPGSLRGLSWYFHRAPHGETPRTYPAALYACRRQVDPLVHPDVPRISDQDFQNCLCEFSKWCKVTYSNGHVRNRFVPSPLPL